jgi:type VI secretion system protein ImpG
VEQAVDSETFRLGCTPIVNLFDLTADAIALSQARYEYEVIPDATQVHGAEVYSINSVVSVDPASNTTTEYLPFYSYRHSVARQSQRTFWYATRRPASRKDDRATDVYLHLVDLDFDPRLPAETSLLVDVTCTNRDLPARLNQAGDDIGFDLEMMAPATLRGVRAPTAPQRPPLARGAYWRLLSHLSLNHLSLSEGEEGRDALKEILRLYDFSDPEMGREQEAVTRQIIEGILSVRSRRVIGRVPGATASGFCRGVEVTIELDEQKYVGTGVYLFASVLERFLGLYVSINSFSQLVARTSKGEGPLKRWPPRAGDQTLL